MPDTLMEAFLHLRRDTDQEFARAKRLHGRRMKCCVGCDACCSSPFSISEFEAARIFPLVESLPPPVRAGLLERARAYLLTRRRLFKRYGFRESRGALAPPEQQLPCPALEAGRCLIYEERPLMCRRFGAPAWSPQYPDRVFACALNFPQGAAIRDPPLLGIQKGLAMQSERLDEAFGAHGCRRYREPITVAHALLEDFRRLLA